MALGKDNALYLAQYGAKGRTNAIRKIDANGIITTIAGEYTLGGGFAGDGGPAALARLYNPMGLAFAPDGSLLIADSGNNRIRKIDANGIITTVAGRGINYCLPTCGDNGPATDAVLSFPRGMAVAPDGSFYFVDYGFHLVRRVDKNGIISIVAGKRGVAGFTGDGGPAVNALLNYPIDVALDKQGNLYITDGYNHRIRKITPDGMINTVAGFGGTGPSATGYSGDGGPATGAKMYMPWKISVMPDGSLLIVEYGNHILRIVNQAGVINTIVGGGTGTTDGSPAYTANILGGISAPTLPLPNGEFYMVIGFTLIARVTNANPGFNALDYAIASEDGSTLWMFDRNGKHLQTKNTLTGAVVSTFGYDAGGKLITVTDGDGNVTLSLSRRASMQFYLHLLFEAPVIFLQYRQHFGP